MLVKKFISYIETERQYSELTVSSYTRDISQFLIYTGLDPEGIPEELEAVTYRQVRAFVMHLGEEGYSRASVNRKISSLKSFFSWLLTDGWVQENPARKVVSLKKDRMLPKFVELSAMERLVNDLLPARDDYFEERDAAILLLLYGTGIRVSELAYLRKEDFAGDFSEVRIFGKGKKERIVPLLRPVAKKIEHLIFLRDNICESANNYVFLSQANVPMNRSAVYRIVSSKLAAYGVDGKKSPHVLRHTFATHLLNNGAGIETVRELLGHESLATTQIYTHNDVEQLKKSYAKAHPRGTEDGE